MHSKASQDGCPTWIDAAGRLHSPAGADARIVSLVPSLTELVFDLGLGERLVGRTGFCVHPREALRAVPKVGGTKDVNLARIRELAPTHVLVNMDENRRETVDALAAFVPHIVVTHPNTPQDNLVLFALLGGVFGAEGAAAGVHFLRCVVVDLDGEVSRVEAAARMVAHGPGGPGEQARLGLASVEAQVEQQHVAFGHFDKAGRHHHGFLAFALLVNTMDNLNGFQL
ncbi:MAG TPA: helical backbone metal receptor, partial [Thauera aminoaromatica]|nr:helical backbone metal receptor [Thauera aminoaromatica]